MFEAARVTDGIEHSSALAGFITGALLGIALIAAVAFCTFTCGFGVALVAGLVAGIGAQGLLMAGEAIGSAIKSTAGTITNGSANVFTNSLASAIAETSGVVCSKHPPLPLVAEGSTSVFINSKPAARKGDHITCGAVIGSGSGNVTIGGGTKAVLPFDSEIPEWLRTATDWAFVLAGLAGGLAGVIRKAAGAPLKAMLPCAAKFMAGFAIGEAVGRYVAAPAISAVVGNPVELTTGRKILLAQDEIDFVLNGRLPLTCSRFYGSNLQYEGLLGCGWMHEWDVNLRLHEGEIIHTDFQGRETAFPQIKPGQKIYSVPEQRHLGCTDDGRYFIYGLDEIYYEFGPFLGTNQIAGLCKIEDQVGQRISFERDAQGRLQQIITSAGQRLRLHYEHQRLHTHTGVRLSAVELIAGGTPGVLVRYQYDANGQLSDVFNQLNQAMRSFTYENGLMVEHVNALGLACQYRWQTIDGQPRVVEHRSSEGEHYQFGYDPAERKSWATDTFGRRASWRYDANFQVVESIYFDGSHNRFEYNPDGNLTALHLPGERKVSFEYDDLGRLTHETDPLGRISQTEYHQASLRPLCQTLPDASKWYAGYDPRGLLLSTQDPLGRRTLYTWGANGLLEKVVDARGGQKTMEWNAQGNITAYTDCSGKTTRYAYDENGYLISATDALGNQTRFTYTATGEQSSIIEADGEQEQFEYDALGLLRRHTNAHGQTRTWTRNARGQVTHEVNFARRSQQCRYDAHGRLLELINGNGAAYRFEYDAADRVQRQTNVDGIQTEYGYDQRGELAQIVVTGTSITGMVEQRITKLEHDNAGRLLARHNQSASTFYQYDAVDRLLCANREPTPTGVVQGIAPDTLNFNYDKAGQLIKEDGVNGAISYELDELGNVSQMTLPHSQSMGFLRYGSGHTHQISFGDKVICDIERDDLHREIMRTQGRLTARFGFDARGRRAWQNVCQNGQIQTQLSRSYSYGLQNELRTKADQLRGTTAYQYDPEGRLLTSGTADQRYEQFGWDGADNLQTRYRGYVGDDSLKNNRLMVWQDLRYAYDAFGNVQTKLKGNWQAQHFTYDADNRLLQINGNTEHGQSTTRFHYDALGRRIAKQVIQPGNSRPESIEETRFIWQGMRMAQEIQADQLSTYVYDPDAEYSPLARLDHTLNADGSINDDISPTLYYFHTDQIGTPMEMTQEDGSLVWAGDYSTWGKVSWQHPGASPLLQKRIKQNLRFAGQYADESTGLHYNTFRFYDPDIGRFLSQDPIGLAGGMNLYQYAPNPVGWIDPLGWITVYHYTSQAGYNAISSQKPFDFRASTPGKGHPTGVYVTTKSPEELAKTPNGYKKLGLTGEKSTHFFEIKNVDPAKLRGIEGKRSKFIKFFPSDTKIERSNVARHGKTPGKC